MKGWMNTAGVSRELAALDVGLTVSLRDADAPYFVGVLFRAGVLGYVHLLSSSRRIYMTRRRAVAVGDLCRMAAVAPPFDAGALYRLLDEVPRGDVTQSRYFRRLWRAGVQAYTVDAVARTVTYYGMVGHGGRSALSRRL